MVYNQLLTDIIAKQAVEIDRLRAVLACRTNPYKKSRDIATTYGLDDDKTKTLEQDLSSVYYDGYYDGIEEGKRQRPHHDFI